MTPDEPHNPAATEQQAIDVALSRSGMLSEMETGFVEEQRRSALEPGRVLSRRFEIVRMIGAGGMGAVYEAKDRILADKAMALKVMLPSLIASEQARERFTREAMLTRDLRHPCIVNVYDVGMDEDLLYLTMELVRGESANDWRRKRGGKVDAKNASGFMHKVAEALRYAHDHGVIHRDLKPQNVLVIRGGGIRLVDFGLARAVGGHGYARTQAALGTPYYMAPEQTRNAPDVDARADIYSCGVMLYQLVTGELPMGRFPLPSEVVDGLPRQLDELVDQCLQSVASRRLGTMKEMLARLEEIYGAVTGQAAGPRTKPSQTAARPPRPSPSRPAKPKASPRPETRRSPSPQPKPQGSRRVAPAADGTTPRGWAAETRHVTVAMPKGAFKKDITYYLTSIGMPFVLIPAGESMAGSPDDEEGRRSDEGPVHKVRIDKPFFLAATPMAQHYCEKLTGENPSRHRGANRPVESASWEEVQQLLKLLCEREGVAPGVYRLPTEAEWEYACRAGSQTPFYTPDLGRIAWHNADRDGQTHDVGKKLPNAFGLHDMIGNVWEWCQDLYARDYYRNCAPHAPGPRAGQGRVCRGGGWDSAPELCRSACRDFHAATHRAPNLGFRLARTVE